MPIKVLKSFLSRSLALAGLLGLAGASTAPAAGWVARHGLTAAEYQAEFNLWTAPPYNLRLVCISGSETSGEARFAAIWDDTGDSAWSAVHGWAEADFTQKVTTLRGQGWRPVFFSAFGVGSGAFFNGIFEPTAKTNFVFYSKLTWTAYSSTAISLDAQGYALVDICPYNIGAQDYYAALWEKAGRISVPENFHHRETSAQYQTTFNDQIAQGWHLESVRGFTINGSARFTSHWRKPWLPDWWSYNGMSAVNYQGETWNAVYQAYRPTFLSAYTEGGQTRYNAIWTRNGGFALDTIGQIDGAVRGYMQQHGVPGLTVALAREGHLVFAKGYGYADQEAGETVHPLHRFRIASVSKPFCAGGMLTLVDKGQVALTNKVFGTGALLGTTYGNGVYSTREKQITVQELLSHTTGWTGSADDPIWDNANGNNTATVISQVLNDHEPSFPPGTHYEYKNVDFCVAARIIEKKTGKTFEQYVKDAVLAPCGITDMEIGNQTKAGRKPNEVVYYDKTGRDPYVDINPHRMDANGGWIGTALDLLLYGRRIDGKSTQKDLLSSNALTAMRTGSSDAPTYGLGWFWDNGRTWYAHNGCMTGTLGWLITRDDDIQIAVITNLRPNDDDCAWTLNGVLMGIGDGLKSANVWPAIDLFPSANQDFDLWSASQFAASVLANLGLKESVWGPFADPDRDGVPNILEAYLNQNPLKAASAVSGRAFISGGNLVYRWLRPLDSHGVESTLLSAAHVGEPAKWTSVGITLTTPPRLIAPAGFQWTDATLSLSNRPSAFIKMDLSVP